MPIPITNFSTMTKSKSNITLGALVYLDAKVVVKVAVIALVASMWMGQVFAACTYNEAIMAYENGNTVRGQALMTMAARDGDSRAVRFFANTWAGTEHQGTAKHSQGERLAVVDTISGTTDEKMESGMGPVLVNTKSARVSTIDIRNQSQ